MDADPSWLRYDDDFRAQLLVPLIVLMATRLALFTVATVSERWRARTELVRTGLWVAFVAMLVSALVGWDIFAAPRRSLVQDLAVVFLLVNIIQIWIWTRNALMRVRVPRDASAMTRAITLGIDVALEDIEQPVVDRVVHVEPRIRS